MVKKFSVFLRRHLNGFFKKSLLNRNMFSITALNCCFVARGLYLKSLNNFNLIILITVCPGTEITGWNHLNPPGSHVILGILKFMSEIKLMERTVILELLRGITHLLINM